ncbi:MULTISPECIES: hypothetical protein [Streptomyces]|uniref:Uncharacterized protein n=1 Tax=Streptomyces sudanensis TaxID=436397 RepID=A0ABY4TAU8_9ACTN|nr:MULTISPECIES: hypothetical protein [Streptomyces]URN16086.1 hypothetical protein MW084_09150 [Streptomyces sudanensis]
MLLLLVRRLPGLLAGSPPRVAQGSWLGRVLARKARTFAADHQESVIYADVTAMSELAA